MRLNSNESGARELFRKNMFLSAVIQTSSGSSPVTVRNMSASGAMIEAQTAPIEGTLLKLVRGPLQALGRVAWQADRQCGIRFEAGIDVDRWLLPLRNLRQQEVDGVFSSTFRAHSDAISGRPSQNRTTDADVAETAETVANLLRAVADQFANDPILVATRFFELQAFDVAVQALEAIRSRESDSPPSRLHSAVEACKHLLNEIQAANRQ